MRNLLRHIDYYDLRSETALGFYSGKEFHSFFLDAILVLKGESDAV